MQEDGADDFNKPTQTSALYCWQRHGKSFMQDNGSINAAIKGGWHEDHVNQPSLYVVERFSETEISDVWKCSIPDHNSVLGY